MVFTPHTKRKLMMVIQSRRSDGHGLTQSPASGGANVIRSNPETKFKNPKPPLCRSRLVSSRGVVRTASAETTPVVLHATDPPRRLLPAADETSVVTDLAGVVTPELIAQALQLLEAAHGTSGAVESKRCDLNEERARTRVPSSDFIDTRMNGPGVKTDPPVYLSQLLAAYYERAADAKCESSWSGYRTLVRKWEAFHDGDGPPVQQLTADRLQAFFEGVSEWRSERSWVRNRDLLFKLFKTACRQTIDNVDGLTVSPILSVDALPVWSIPRGRWFRDRADKTSQSTEKRGGHKKRKLELLKLDEFGAVLAACDHVSWMSPPWWKAWLSLIWFCGLRFEDSFRLQWASGPLHVNLSRRVLDMTETKCGGDIAVPLPSWLLQLLESLHDESRIGLPVFTAASRKTATAMLASRSDISNRERFFGPQYREIWTRAGVELRQPHEVRGVCISRWLKHDARYRFAVTGHKPPKADVQLNHYVTLDDEFRQSCESFPFPLNALEPKK